MHTDTLEIPVELTITACHDAKGEWAQDPYSIEESTDGTNTKVEIEVDETVEVSALDIEVPWDVAQPLYREGIIDYNTASDLRLHQLFDILRDL